MCETNLLNPPKVDLEPSVTVLEQPTIGQLFRMFGPAYRQKYASRMSRDQLKVMAKLQSCRTAALGSVHYYCRKCQRHHYVPQSCGNRHCPACQGAKAKQWLEDQWDRLLPCPYFLITFTVPMELRQFVREHPRECYRALFNAAAATLTTLAGNPKYVGSRRLGFTGVLHTWGRSLCFHPHVHFLVPGGAISPDSQSWLSSRADFFVPVHAASKMFRAKFMDAMKEHGLDPLIPKQVWSKAWVVHSKPVGDGRRALRYLAPYVFRVAISNRRIERCQLDADGQWRVTFTYRKSGSRHYRPMTVTVDEFIRRFLQHVLPSGFQKVRHFGFAHPRHRIDRQWLQMLVTVSLNQVYVLNVAAKPLAIKHVPKCSHCGEALECLGFVPATDPRQYSFDTS